MSNKLKQLLTDLHSSEGDTLEKFGKIAEVLMKQMCIQVGLKRYRIAECEFYYDSNQSYIDPFLYCDKTKQNNNGPEMKQNQLLQWFFHYSGVDVTIGNAGAIFGGILIRSLQCINHEKNYIAGPLKSVNALLNDAHKSVIADTAIMKLVDLTDDEYCMEDLIKTARIGLDKGKTANDTEHKYHQHKCRFVYSGFINSNSIEVKQYNNRLNKLIHSQE